VCAAEYLSAELKHVLSTSRVLVTSIGGRYDGPLLARDLPHSSPEFILINNDASWRAGTSTGLDGADFKIVS